MKKIKCKCVNVQLGTYANSVALFPPADLGITRVPVTVDRCIAEEVQFLWSIGIVTTGNCCGHNKRPGYISVREDFIPRMIALGYQKYQHPDGLDDHFQPRRCKNNSTK